LGITPFIGHLFNLPLDIAHVAFSSAYLGFGAMHIDMPLSEFLFYLGYVFLIGLVNLLVSFMLALKVSLLSRDAYFGNLFLFLKLLFVEMLKRPHQLIFPFGNKEGKQGSAH
jgi:site-specific recombinase